MRDEDARLLRELLTGHCVLSLAVTVDGEPAIGLLPFAADPDAGALLVHVSRLARHSKGLGPGARFAALIHADAVGDPLQVPRVMLEGVAEALEGGGDQWRRARDLYLAALPSAEVTFGLGDFTLYRLAVERGRLVAGFARTVNLRSESLRSVLADG